MDKCRLSSIVTAGESVLGIEFGSTRIKAVLIGPSNDVIAMGTYTWENQLINQLWTYSTQMIQQGLQEAYLDLKNNVRNLYNIELISIKSIGISAMMHGYIPLDENNNLLVPFRTWRNTNTVNAAEKLTELFNFNIPLRWSVSHLYQSILDKEGHVREIKKITTLAGYIHLLLTGKHVLGVGDASGMFPISSDGKGYDNKKLNQFQDLIRGYQFPWEIKDILPNVMFAGEVAGQLTAEGALLLDPEGDLKSGSLMCPPEGDAGTGMIATNSIKPRTGNISAGTSIFSMIVLEKPLQNNYPEIDIVTTPVGDAVAMVHANNCTTELNSWMNLFKELAHLVKSDIDAGDLYSIVFNNIPKDTMSDEPLLVYPYHSGEDITKVSGGCPLFVRTANSKFNLSTFMKSQLFGAFAAVALGMQLLTEKEHVNVESILGHGGIFKTEGIAQRYLACALHVPVEVMSTASEGGAWGIAILANYINYSSQMSLNEFLSEHVFKDIMSLKVNPQVDDMKEFDQFLANFKVGLAIEQKADQLI